ncbi:MAG: sensor histidine kinase [Thermodesulfobacteriota bacterium]|nr:sensor histidine kinase [Thermodesulfobacteriota bacterium]
MAWKISESAHILTLVIKRDRDIPLVRTKTKLLAREMGFERLAVIQLATSASEVARLLLRMFGGGQVRLSAVRFENRMDSCGLELILVGRKPCTGMDGLNESVACPANLNDLKIAPINGLRKVLDEVTIKGEKDSSIRLYCLKYKGDCDWQELQVGASEIKNQLFRDTEESYVENLRAKHEEVRQLLKEKSAKNIELDRVNTDLLQLNQELEALANERTIGEMALKIADQVRNPASVIGGLTRLLRKKLPELGSREAEKIDAIENQAAKLEEIVASFESLADKQSLYFIEEDLVEVVQEAVNSCNTLQHKGVGTKLLLADSPIIIKANRPILKIALLHVLRNSADVSLPGSEVEVRADLMDGQPMVSVADRGEGFPSEIRKKLFFGPVESRKKGTGLGLLIVKQIMEEHQATISIEDREGGGTVVFLKFPIRWQERM